MSKSLFTVTVSVAEGREDEVPQTLKDRIHDMILLMFQEEIDEGIIDINLQEAK